MAGGFKRSKWFGLIGVFVIAGLAIVIALPYPTTPGFDYRLRGWTVLAERLAAA